MANLDFGALSTFGAKFIIELSSTSLNDQERAALAQLRPAGVMFRRRNFVQDVEYSVWLEQYRLLLQQIREIVGSEQLLVCIDHEGGRVIRPPAPITRFPYPSRWADRAKEVAEAAAVELKSLGINVVFAPVADIHSNPANPVINQRAFGRTVSEVIGGTGAFAETMLANGVLPCAKHFPGHGDTSADSHYELPVLPHSLTQLEQRELLPFQALIRSGIPLIMTAHLMIPAIDAENPATISRTMLHDILREQLGFRGAIVADAMGMKAIIHLLEDYQSTVKALQAGLDLYCVAGDAVSMEHALRWAGFMREAVRRGDVSEEIVSSSLTRIAALQQQAARHEVQELPDSLFERHAALAAELDARKDWEYFELRLPGFE